MNYVLVLYIVITGHLSGSYDIYFETKEECDLFYAELQNTNPPPVKLEKTEIIKIFINGSDQMDFMFEACLPTKRE